MPTPFPSSDTTEPLSGMGPSTDKIHVHLRLIRTKFWNYEDKEFENLFNPYVLWLMRPSLFHATQVS